jgi:hypothetical protein
MVDAVSYFMVDIGSDLSRPRLLRFGECTVAGWSAGLLLPDRVAGRRPIARRRSPRRTEADASHAVEPRRLGTTMPGGPCLPADEFSILLPLTLVTNPPSPIVPAGAASAEPLGELHPAIVVRSTPVTNIACLGIRTGQSGEVHPVDWRGCPGNAGPSLASRAALDSKER